MIMIKRDTVQHDTKKNRITSADRKKRTMFTWHAQLLLTQRLIQLFTYSGIQLLIG